MLYTHAAAGMSRRGVALGSLCSQNFRLQLAGVCMPRDISLLFVPGTRLRVGHGKRLLRRTASRPPSLPASSYGGGSIEPEQSSEKEGAEVLIG